MTAKRIVIVALVLGAILIGVAATKTALHASATPLVGVELGMSPGEVQSALSFAGEGVFMVGSAGGEPLLEWNARTGGRATPARARFEFRDRALHRVTLRWPPTVSRDEAIAAIAADPTIAVGEEPFFWGHDVAIVRLNERGLEFVYASSEEDLVAPDPDSELDDSLDDEVTP